MMRMLIDCDRAAPSKPLLRAVKLANSTRGALPAPAVGQSCHNGVHPFLACFKLLCTYGRSLR